MTTTPNSSYNYKTQRQQHTTRHITMKLKDNNTHNSSYNYKSQRQQHTTRHIAIKHNDNNTQFVI